MDMLHFQWKQGLEKQPGLMIQKKLFLFLLQGIIYLWLIDSGKSFL